ncbi:MAG: hypothetical protein KC431_15320, partial [Myxococcales bacterium]|nr:hypothetical protein [Myxococcales bacterium]
MAGSAQEGQRGRGESARDWAAKREGGKGTRVLAPDQVLEGAADVGDYERDETSARAYRLNKILSWGGIIYLAFIPTDFSYNVMRGTDHGLTFALIRVLVAAPLLLLWFRLRKPEGLTLRQLIVFEAGGISLVASSIAVMSLLDGGVDSPLIAGLVPVMVARGISIPDRWPRAALLTMAPVLAFAVVMAIGIALDPSLGGLSSSSLAELVLYAGLMAATGIMVVYGSHIAWDLRRNLHRAHHVGRYQLRRQIGRGGMGEVWAAWHTGLRQEVALKVLPLPRVPSERAARAVARFEREVFATTKLRHPNTVRVYDFGLSAEGFWYYAMGLLDGETVAEIVGREGPLAVERALHLLRQAARALGEAHQQGIIH